MSRVPVQKSKLDDRYGADVGNIPNANQKGCSQQDYRSEACTATLQQYGRSGEQGPGTRHPVPKDNQDEEIGEEPEEDEEETATLFEQASMGHSRVVLPSPQGTSRKPACMKSSRKKKRRRRRILRLPLYKHLRTMTPWYRPLQPLEVQRTLFLEHLNIQAGSQVQYRLSR